MTTSKDSWRGRFFEHNIYIYIYITGQKSSRSRLHTLQEETFWVEGIAESIHCGWKLPKAKMRAFAGLLKDPCRDGFVGGGFKFVFFIFTLEWGIFQWWQTPPHTFQWNEATRPEWKGTFPLGWTDILQGLRWMSPLNAVFLSPCLLKKSRPGTQEWCVFLYELFLSAMFL